MNVAFSAADLKNYLTLASDVSPDHPIVITKFIEGAQEIDVDAVASHGELLVYAVSQHVENAGVHSGDATLILPPVYEHEQNENSNLGLRGLTSEIIEATKVIAEKVAKAFKITGPYNMQLILSRSPGSSEFTLKVIECNLRASRSFPFVSKVLDKNFIDVATHAIVGAPELESILPKTDLMKIDRGGVKAVKCPVFSWTRLPGADPILGVEMASTGEIACFGKDVYEAYFTSLFANHNNFKNLPMTKGSAVLISLDDLSNPKEVAYVAEKLLGLGYRVLADDTLTLSTIQGQGIDDVTLLSSSPLTDLLSNTKILGDIFAEQGVEAMFSFCRIRPREPTSLKYKMRSASVSMGLGYLNDSKNALLFVDALGAYVTGARLKKDAVFSAADWTRH
jgi:hypothetical protein